MLAAKVDQLLANYTRVREMLLTKFDSISTGALLKFERFNRNPVANSLLFGSTLIVTIVLAIVSGCQSLGVPSPSSFNQKLVIAYLSITSVRESTTVLLQSKVIPVNDARNIEAQADNARAALDIAQTVYATDPAGAQTKLDTTLTAITALQAYVASKKGKGP